MAGVIVEKEPKSEAGRRTIIIPANVIPYLTSHLQRFVEPGTDALVIVGEYGGPLRPQVLSGAWSKARKKVGRDDLHLHDLRHSGLTWAAATGATVAELMRPAGHSPPAAAMRYQHATEDRDRVLADALAVLAKGAEIVDLEPLADTTRTKAISRKKAVHKNMLSSESGRRESNSRSQLGKLSDTTASQYLTPEQIP